MILFPIRVMDSKKHKRKLKVYYDRDLKGDIWTLRLLPTRQGYMSKC